MNDSVTHFAPHIDKVTQEESLNQSMNQSEQLCLVKRFKRVTEMKLLFQLNLYFLMNRLNE